ncbi:MAG: hypothetical protein H7318_10865 [Oligoflexus sp.]|nr:hypothetical protein [Oligoflexus sp.]
MKKAYLVFLLGLFIASPAFAHKVPFKEKYYLNLANGDGYKAMKLKNFCTGKNEEACRKQLGLWKIDPAQIEIRFCRLNLKKWS